MATKTTLVTYDDYRNLPDNGNRYEIIGGELFMTPAPTIIHQRILGKLYKSISTYTEEKDIGEVFIAPVDVVLSMTDIVDPDLFFITNERSEIITKKNVVAAPDLVVEVLSENTAAIDLNRKKDLYENYGVKEYWIVYPEEKQIAQFLLQDDIYKLNSEYTISDKLTSVVIDKFSISLNEVFSS